jgi:CspA family cold shock protein
VTVLSAAPSVVKGTRKPADDVAIIVEDLIKLLDGVSNQLRRGKYPPDAQAHKVAAVLRAVADDLDI